MKTSRKTIPRKKPLRIEEITRIEADINYSHLFMASGKRIILARTLKTYEKDLPLPFLRVNRSCMININFLQRNQTPQNKTIKMIDGTEIAISRRRIHFVSEAIAQVI
jgi:two-component system LytT family response regulator